MKTVLVDINRLFEHTVHRFSAEASELGWAPGFVPHQLTVEGLGNGQPFQITGDSNSDKFVYAQIFGCITITVFND